jgi:GNAT superfamily N-acetyltransferase
VQWHWSQAWYWFEVLNYVHPDYRRSDRGKRQIQAAKWWVDQYSALTGVRTYLLCGVLGTYRIPAKIRMYRRLATQVGAAFLYPAPPAGGGL